MASLASSKSLTRRKRAILADEDKHAGPRRSNRLRTKSASSPKKIHTPTSTATTSSSVFDSPINSLSVHVSTAALSEPMSSSSHASEFITRTIRLPAHKGVRRSLVVTLDSSQSNVAATCGKPIPVIPVFSLSPSRTPKGPRPPPPRLTPEQSKPMMEDNTPDQSEPMIEDDPLPGPSRSSADDALPPVHPVRYFSKEDEDFEPDLSPQPTTSGTWRISIAKIPRNCRREDPNCQANRTLWVQRQAHWLEAKGFSSGLNVTEACFMSDGFAMDWCTRRPVYPSTLQQPLLVTDCDIPSHPLRSSRLTSSEKQLSQSPAGSRHPSTPLERPRNSAGRPHTDPPLPSNSSYTLPRIPSIVGATRSDNLGVSPPQPHKPGLPSQAMLGNHIASDFNSDEEAAVVEDMMLVETDEDDDMQEEETLPQGLGNDQRRAWNEYLNTASSFLHVVPLPTQQADCSELSPPRPSGIPVPTFDFESRENRRSRAMDSSNRIRRLGQVS